MKVVEGSKNARLQPSPRHADAAHCSSSHSGAQDAALLMSEVIAEALDHPPVASTANLFSYFKQQLGMEVGSPSLAMFRRAFAAERARRRATRAKASALAVAQVGEHVGDRRMELASGERLADRRVCELVVTALTMPNRSPRLGEAYLDYLHVSSTAGQRGICKEDFRMLALSSLIADGVPHEIMPDWWKKAHARASIEESRRISADGRQRELFDSY